MHIAFGVFWSVFNLVEWLMMTRLTEHVNLLISPMTLLPLQMNSLSKESDGYDINEETAQNDDSSEHGDTEFPRLDSSPNECDTANVPPVPCSGNSAENHMCKPDYDSQDAKNPTPLDSLENNKIVLKTQRKYRVDILRCESLAALEPATLDRLVLNYDMIASMVPLPSSSVLPGPSGPIHFGPLSYSSVTPWMKLVLYTLIASGPLSAVSMKGQCLRLLPAPLAGCDKALVWSWDGSTVGGLGGKFDGNLVNGSVLLHCLNSMLKHSAVLAQPPSRYDLDDSGRIVTVDVALPLKNFDGLVQPMKSDMGLDPEGIENLNPLLNDLSSKIELFTIDYIRLLRLHKEIGSDMFQSEHENYEWVPSSLDFGIPLFSPKLCGRICERIVLSHLLQKDSLSEHHDAMQSLRKRLLELCSEYQATGPTAMLFYHREQIETPHKLISYASGRWNPLTEPTTPRENFQNIIILILN